MIFYKPSLRAINSVVKIQQLQHQDIPIQHYNLILTNPISSFGLVIDLPIKMSLDKFRVVGI